jgi:hypothetical protein
MHVEAAICCIPKTVNITSKEQLANQFNFPWGMIYNGKNRRRSVSYRKNHSRS